MARFRVYYNKTSDYPYVWSFDDGNQKNEQTVREIHGPRFNSAVNTSGDNVSIPTGFIWVTADRVLVQNGIATFYD